MGREPARYDWYDYMGATMAVIETISLDDVDRLLCKACERLMHDDAVLFGFDVNERTLTQRLSLYLQPEFPEFKVDCEYNRYFDDIKRLPIPPEDVLSDDTKATTVFPDIVVHARNRQDLNLLVIEAKKSERTGEIPYRDEKKLEAFTSSSKGFNYKWGAYLNFSPKNTNRLYERAWFEYGTRVTHQPDDAFRASGLSG